MKAAVRTVEQAIDRATESGRLRPRCEGSTLAMTTFDQHRSVKWAWLEQAAGSIITNQLVNCWMWRKCCLARRGRGAATRTASLRRIA